MLQVMAVNHIGFMTMFKLSPNHRPCAKIKARLIKEDDKQIQNLTRFLFLSAVISGHFKNNNNQKAGYDFKHKYIIYWTIYMYNDDNSKDDDDDKYIDYNDNNNHFTSRFIRIHFRFLRLQKVFQPVKLSSQLVIFPAPCFYLHPWIILYLS